MGKNNIENRIYECAVCGTKHITIEERTKCETACVNKLKELEAKRAAEKKKAEEEKSRTEVMEAYAHFQKLMKEHVAKYGSIAWHEESNNDIESIVDKVLKDQPFRYFWL